MTKLDVLRIMQEVFHGTDLTLPNDEGDELIALDYELVVGKIDRMINIEKQFTTKENK